MTDKATLKLVNDLLESDREYALVELSKRRETIENLAVLLWNKRGIMTRLLQELLAIYPLLNPLPNQPVLTTASSNRACNALALMQCIASHEETRDSFLESRLPLFLYPFLNTTGKSKPFEYIRLTSLGVIGALVKSESLSVVDFLLKTEIIPLCLRILDIGTELSKTVSLFILQKIISAPNGMAYVSGSQERLDAICAVLVTLIASPFVAELGRVVKHTLKCLHSLSINRSCLQRMRGMQLLRERISDSRLKRFVSDEAPSAALYQELCANILGSI